VDAATSLLARALQAREEPAPDHRDRVEERIVDAALQLVAAAGTRHLTMDDVALRAGVGRMTVYRRFATRQALIDALALREARRCLERIATSFDPRDPIEVRASDVFLATLAVIAEHPLLERLARHEPEALLRELTRNDSEVFGLVRAFLVAQITRAQSAGELGPVDPEILAELVVRLAASYVLIPGGLLVTRDEQTVRKTIKTLLAQTR
jgi:AcrR family transcriptional regulator